MCFCDFLKAKLPILIENKFQFGHNSRQGVKNLKSEGAHPFGHSNECTSDWVQQLRSC